jgi:hypothetical protein
MQAMFHFGRKFLFDGYLIASKILCDGYVINKACSNCKSLIIMIYLCDGYVIKGNFLFDGYLILKQK